MRGRSLGLLIWFSFSWGCTDDAGVDPIVPPAVDEPPVEGPEETAPGDPAALAIGFNAGYADQFDFFGDFYTVAAPGPRLCHAYVSWNVALQPPNTGSIEDHASRAFIEDWLASAQGHCDEALISFKAMAEGPVPSTSAFAAAFEKFVAIDWAATTGFAGGFAFTPWNEPNNPAKSGNGLGLAIPPRVAARYYLVAERACRARGCKVAAGDFASNGSMWDDYKANCATADVAPAELCATASYLDLYKNEIVNGATALGLPVGLRPQYFALHGWHDSNRYLDAADHCGTYETCTLRRVLRSMRGTWDGVELWNTEDGIGQTSSPDDDAQGCGAAFLVRLSTISSRVRRLYITRLRGGPGQLFRADRTPRPAMTVLATRQRTFGSNCP